VNQFDEREIDETSCAYRQLVGVDRHETFTVSASINVVGTATYAGRYRLDGSLCQFQISASATTSVAMTAGTSYFSLPVEAAGIGGVATMVNTSTNIAVGTCAIDVTNSRVYPPSQAASAATFAICGYYERAQ
jgi:hypothetical protein